MPLEYKSQIGLDAIMPVLDEYIVWYSKIVRSYFQGVPFKEAPPGIFLEWLGKSDIPENTQERGRGIYQGMIDSARVFVTKYASRENPPLSEYNEFSGYYEEFIQYMRRLELDLATENSGFDEKTGLRSPRLMKDDIAREMERRARRGNPLSLALVKINNYRPEWKKEEKSYRDVIAKIADQVKECLRSFDDAYYLGDEYYLLSFKHADLVGSQAAMTRLNRAITQAHIPTPGDPMEGVSVSSVLCEPTPGDSIDQLLVNMKKDLMNVDEKGVVLQYNEMSPIQRYMLSMEKGK